jgi:acyl-CoA synthetase (AMP-forming)/AMP-acid ligase II
MPRLPKTITAPVRLVGAVTENAFEVARFGGLATDEQPSPYEVTLEHRVFRLRRYYSGSRDGLRLFIGSGMPAGLCRRIEERFRPARVVEFYASTEVGAILANVRGAKPGSMGRPLPGNPEVRIAAFDFGGEGLVLGRDGFAKRCGVDEVGMLLARVSPNDPLSVTPLRSLFARDDAWAATGDLFRRDAGGDYWRVGGIGDVIRTAAAPGVHTRYSRRSRGDPGRRARAGIRRARSESPCGSGR